MTSSQINIEIENTKTIMDCLKELVQSGQMEYYKDYIDTCAYYLQLMRVKPEHNLKVA